MRSWLTVQYKTQLCWFKKSSKQAVLKRELISVKLEDLLLSCLLMSVWWGSRELAGSQI